MDDNIYGLPLEVWNSLTEDEQLSVQDSYEYDLFHEDQKEWFID